MTKVYYTFWLDICFLSINLNLKELKIRMDIYETWKLYKSKMEEEISKFN
jgi:hypothetical protein